LVLGKTDLRKLKGNPPDVVFTFVFGEFKKNSQLLNQLNDELSENLDQIFKEEDKQIEPKINKADETTQKEWKEYKSWREDVMKRRMTGHTNAPIIFTSDHLAGILGKGKIQEDGKLVNSFGFHGKFIREMGLVFLVSKFESFLYDNLRYMFQISPKSIIKNDRTISYKELFSFIDLEQMKEALAEKEAKKILRKSIENINKELKELQIIDLSDDDEWSRFVEHVYRRHYLVHSDGLVDDEYNEKFGITQGDNTQTTLFVNKEFLELSINLFNKYANLIQSAFKKKFSTIT
jgi:hypothetical protein